RQARRRLLTAFSSICLAVDFAHKRGVLHRDLKPGNVMLGDFGEVYLLDWGLAKLLGDAQDRQADTTVDVASDPAHHTIAGARLERIYLPSSTRFASKQPRSIRPNAMRLHAS